MDSAWHAIVVLLRVFLVVNWWKAMQGQYLRHSRSLGVVIIRPMEVDDCCCGHLMHWRKTMKGWGWLINNQRTSSFWHYIKILFSYSWNTEKAEDHAQSLIVRARELQERLNSCYLVWCVDARWKWSASAVLLHSSPTVETLRDSKEVPPVVKFLGSAPCHLFLVISFADCSEGYEWTKTFVEESCWRTYGHVPKCKGSRIPLLIPIWEHPPWKAH